MYTSYSPGERLRLILTVKMETRHHVGGPLSREFSAFVIIAESRRPEVARRGIFLTMFAV